MIAIIDWNVSFLPTGSDGWKGASAICKNDILVESGKSLPCFKLSSEWSCGWISASTCRDKATRRVYRVGCFKFFSLGRSLQATHLGQIAIKIVTKQQEKAQETTRLLRHSALRWLLMLYMHGAVKNRWEKTDVKSSIFNWIFKFRKSHWKIQF